MFARNGVSLFFTTCFVDRLNSGYTARIMDVWLLTEGLRRLHDLEKCPAVFSGTAGCTHGFVTAVMMLVEGKAEKLVVVECGRVGGLKMSARKQRRLPSGAISRPQSSNNRSVDLATASDSSR